MSRVAKGHEIADRGEVVDCGNDTDYTVGEYRVDRNGPTCECADFTYRGGRCKHIEAVDYALDTDQVVYADCDDSADCPF